MTVREAIAQAARSLSEAGIDDPVREARLLLALQPAWPLERQLARPESALGQTAVDALFGCVARRATGEPYAYIAGQAGFFGRSFAVGPGVLIPRPETEQLVGWWLDAIKADRAARDDKSALCLVDLCCGSGCIGLTAALELASAGFVIDALYLVDVSADALVYAARNAAALAPQLAVQVIEADLFFEPWPAADIVLANPPYIDLADDDALSDEVRRFEPLLALDGGRGGLDFYRRLAVGLAERVLPGNLIGVEHGYRQAEAVRAIFRAARFDVAAGMTDYSGHKRGLLLYSGRTDSEKHT